VSNYRNKRTSFTQALILFLPLAILSLSIVLSKPYFGLMDDAKHKLQVDGIHTFQELIYEIILNGFFAEMTRGFITYTNYAITLPLYFIENSIYFFLVHVFLVWAYILSFAFSVALYIHRLHPKISKMSIMVVLTTIIYSYPFTMELFFFPSLQEKSIILAAPILLGFYALTINRNTKVYFLAMFFSLVIVLGTKIQVIFLLAILVLLLGNTVKINHKNRFRIISLSVLVVLTSTILILVSFLGTYTGKFYDNEKKYDLSVSNIVVAFLIILCFTGFLGSRIIESKTNLKGLKRISNFFIPIGFYLIGVFIWGSGIYLLSLIGLLLCVPLTLIALKFYPLWNKSYAGLIWIPITIFVFIRSYQVFDNMNALENVFEWINKSGRPNSIIVTNCLEGKDSLNYYSKLLLKENVEAEFKFIKNYTMLEGSFILHDKRFCSFLEYLNPEENFEKRNGRNQVYEIYELVK
jgi:hypothetical protein